MKKAVVFLMIISLLSKGFGFIRELALSYYYGASLITDAYFVSQTIPFILFSLFGLAISIGYIPITQRISVNKSEDFALKFTNNLTNLFLLFTIMLVIIFQVFAYEIVRVFAIGFDYSTLDLAVQFSRITIISLISLSAISVYSAFLQLKNKFLMVSLFGFIFNFLVVLSIISSNFFEMKYILVLGGLFAIFLQHILTLKYAKSNGLDRSLIFNLKDENLKELSKISAPLLLGLSVIQLNVLVDKTLASTIIEGGISALNYADRLNSFVLSILVMSLSTVIYPQLSRYINSGKIEKVEDTLVYSFKLILIILTPVMIVTFYFSLNIVELLFGRGQFDSEAIILTSESLRFYSIGIVAIGLREILTRAFYSFENSKSPMINSIYGIIINITLSIILSYYFGLKGLALSTSISAIFVCYLLINELKSKYGIDLFKLFGNDFKIIVLYNLYLALFLFLSFQFIKEDIYIVTMLVISISVYLAAINYSGILGKNVFSLIIKRLQK